MLDKLESEFDYALALLKKMDQLDKAKIGDVIASFWNEYSSMIAPEMITRMNQKEPRWRNWVRWRRQDLVDIGFMGSGGHGIWTITDQGRQWLRDHPNGVGKDLYELISKKERKRPKPIMGEGKNAVKKISSSNRIKHEQDEEKIILQFGDVSTHQAIDREIHLMRTFLQGKSESQLDSEKLCDWVNLCYILGLHSEGVQLFSFVDADEVNEWYYKRTQKLARLCAMKVSLLRT